MQRRDFLLQVAAASAVGPRIPYVDGLSFFPPNPAALKESGLTAFIADVSSGALVKDPDGGQRFERTFEACARSITMVRRDLGTRIPGAFLATRGSDIARAHREGQVAVFLQFQGADPLGEDLARMDMFYELGLRVLQITHHFDNKCGGGALEPKTSGLTKLGVAAVERMNALGIIPDVSHGSDQTALDTVKASKKPVIVSHGAARALVANARCASDDVIRAVASSGGVFGIFMMSFWLTTAERPTVEHLIDQVRHVIKIGGIGAVGISNDYPVTGEASLLKVNNDNAQGVKNYYPWWQQMAQKKLLGFEKLPKHVVIPELNNVRRMFTIHEALERARFTPGEIEKIMGGNWIRVLGDSL